MTTFTEAGGRRTSEFAIASLTMAIVTFIHVFGLERSIPAIVFGVLALRRMKSGERETGKGLAIAGIVLGVIGAVLLPTLGIMYLPQVLPKLAAADKATVRLENQPDLVGAEAQMRKTAQAFESAGAWLRMVDAGQYAEAWDSSASANQEAITKDKMVETYEGFRPRMGPVTSRRLKSADCATSLPGAAPGEYVVIEFNTTFANGGQFLERVTPMLDTDGQWKVSGYYLLNP